MMDLDPRQLDALAAAVREGSLDAAARALHVTPSAVSQRLKALESSVGQLLLVRSRPARPTAAGAVLLRLAGQLRSLTADAVRELGGADGPQRIPLAVNADSLATWVLPALARVGAQLSRAGVQVSFDLHRDDQERTADLLRDGSVLAAITATAEPVAGCSVQRLGRMHYRPTASPAFRRRWFPDGVTPAALGLAPVVLYDRADRLQDRYLRRVSRGRADPPRHYVPASADFAEAVRLGLGWGMLPDQQSAGRGFVDLDPGHGIAVALYWQQWRVHSATVAAIAQEILRTAGETLR